ncbi:hypothetical protein BDV12DRAFT_202072 [Aspergillus spectabilis]
MLESQKPFLDAVLQTASSDANGDPPEIIHDPNALGSHGLRGSVKWPCPSPRTADAAVRGTTLLQPPTRLIRTVPKPQKRPAWSSWMGSTEQQRPTTRTTRREGTGLCFSGIGPKDELQRFGIPVVADLPGVGTNLQDNYETYVLLDSPKDICLLANSPLEGAGDPFLREWVTEGHGPFKSNGEAIGIKKKSTLTTEACHDLLLVGGLSHYRSSPWVLASVLRLISTCSAGMCSKSTHATSGLGQSAFGQPILDSYQSSISETQSGEQEEVHPGPEVADIDSIKKNIKDKAFSHHAASTCGIRADEGPRFVVPSRPGASQVLPTYMISEKATDVLLEDARFGQPKGLVVGATK